MADTVLGVYGLRGLENYDPVTNISGQAHSRARYAILRHLLRDTPSLYAIICNTHTQTLTVHLNRAGILTEDKPSLARMLIRLNIHRCTAAGISKCRTLYEGLSNVYDEALEWKDIVLAHQKPPFAFCHANTYISGDEVVLKEYEATARGVVQSWAETEIL
ncbi:peptidase family M49-domain-containing protein [Aspergillus egyptiacus]|nr:peptidase family M49-domain-containing protein [Aspergillus egyptiacus]